MSAQKCPAGWYGYSLQSKCYRFVSKDAMTWSDARDFCKIHGGDLLRIDSAQEQVRVVIYCSRIRYFNTPREKGLNRAKFHDKRSCRYSKAH